MFPIDHTLDRTGSGLYLEDAFQNKSNSKDFTQHFLQEMHFSEKKMYRLS